jgi:hypothetical protein
LKNAAAFKIRKRVVFPDKEAYQAKDSPRALATPFRQKVLKIIKAIKALVWRYLLLIW